MSTHTPAPHPTEEKKFRVETKVNKFEFSFYVFAKTLAEAQKLAAEQLRTLKKFKYSEILSIDEQVTG
ncbi:MAG: hypothetical protein Q7S87_12830 [Agitococcus sp.]|nr:hypothetical protein [Agitococcus sp.]